MCARVGIAISTVQETGSRHLLIYIGTSGQRDTLARHDRFKFAAIALFQSFKNTVKNSPGGAC